MTPSRARRLLVLWICGFFLLVLPWTDLQDHAHWYKVEWPPRLSSPRRIADVVGNVVGFIPFGYLLTTAWEPRRHGTWPLGLGAALLLSATAESAQLYSHTRFPSIADVAANVAGASMGIWLVRLRQSPQNLTRRVAQAGRRVAASCPGERRCPSTIS